MAEHVYEGFFILDSGRYARDPEGVVGQINKMIQEAGGQILVSRLWEERRLAYPIKGHRKGTYWLTYFRVDGSGMEDVRRKSRLNESILRSLFLKHDPRMVDTLVAHALAGPVVATEASQSTGEERKGLPEDVEVAVETVEDAEDGSPAEEHWKD